MRRQEGYTLVELTVVMTVIATLSLTVLLSIGSLLDLVRLQTAARQLAEDIRWTEQAAITEKCRYEIRFYYNEELYQIRKFNPATNSYGIEKTVRMPGAVDLAGTNFSNNQIAYNTIGGISGVQGGYIGLNAKSNFRYIIVAAVTGRVRIDDKPPAK